MIRRTRKARRKPEQAHGSEAKSKPLKRRASSLLPLYRELDSKEMPLQILSGSRW